MCPVRTIHAIKLEAQRAAKSLEIQSGRYAICFEPATGDNALDPCKWSTPAVTSLTEKLDQTIELTVKRGKMLKVNIQDPIGLLGGTVSTFTPEVSVGAFTSTGSYHGASLRSCDKAGCFFEMAIPSNENLHLSIGSHLYELNASGLSNRETPNLRVPISADEQSLGSEMIIASIVGRK